MFNSSPPITLRPINSAPATALSLCPFRSEGQFALSTFKDSMDQWQEHVRIEINSATDSLRLLDIMQSLSSMEVTDLIPYDIGIDLFNLIDTKNE